MPLRQLWQALRARLSSPAISVSTLAVSTTPDPVPVPTPQAPPPPPPPPPPAPAPAPVPVPVPTPPDAAPEPTAAPALKARRALFNRQVFPFEGERYDFNLFVPAAASADLGLRMPLLVMLHGCQQDAPDFARGTAMNELAARVPCAVLYPEQLSSANPMRCWNWFDLAHQGRHAGEPAMLAALTRQVAARYPVDIGRIYIAGLSAGGAMAAIVAAHNPELFAAVGVHSGLPPGAAHDVMSAFQAMRHGKRAHVGHSLGAARTDSPAQHLTHADADHDHTAQHHLMPTIVFHGSADRTVHPDNSDQIVQAALDAVNAAGLPLTRDDIGQALPARTGELRHTARTVYRGPDGLSYVEHWAVEAGPHAWSGGSESGSFTDPHGPPASQAMLDFFMQHRRLPDEPTQTRTEP